MLRIRAFAPLIGLLLLAACEDDLDIPDFNNEGLGSLLDNPTRTAIGAAATGLLITGRDEFDDRNGYVSLLGILGRESYNFDGSDPRFITEMLQDGLNPSSPAFGGNLWGERYSNIRTAQIILGAVDVIDDAEMPVAEKEATRGFAKTMMAWELLIVVNTRDVNGAVIDIPNDPADPPGPIVSKTEALNRVEQLLDEAAGHLDNGGGSFPFTLSSGFTGFSDPASFRTFNRGLAARVEAYKASRGCTGCGGDWGEVLTDLSESFLIEDASQLDLGVYHVFSTSPGDETNQLFDPGGSPDILAHPSFRDDAQTAVGGGPDLRFVNKTRTVDPQTSLGITTDLAFDIYTSLGAPIPIIRNEELILLRAEAKINMGMLNGPDSALEDINFIRTNSGGLDPLASFADAQAAEDELLYNRRYSLMFEGGHRWIDARRLNRLSDIPIDLPTHSLFTAFPIPEAECLARGLESQIGGGCVGG